MFRRKKSKDATAAHTKQFFRTNKLLLLGTGESGKTTIIKQMKILHINGFSDEERKEKVPFIRDNIHESVYDILSHMSTLSPPEEIAGEEARKAAEYILALGAQYDEFTSEYFDNVKIVWADSGVKRTFQRANEFQLIDCAEYFLDRIDIIRKPDYIPTTQDILYCRVMTVSISKIEFSINVDKKYGGGQAEFWMYDVGGQRGERKKWIQVFDGIQAILFLIAASDFDQTLREDASKNRLEEAFNVFKDIYKSRFVRDAGLIVFLNKQDLLKKKIEQGKRLDQFIPEYKKFDPSPKECNSNDEYEKSKLFMRNKVFDIVKTPLTVAHIGYIPGKFINEELPKRDVYVHYTIATDTNNVKKVFESVQEIILKSNLKTIF